MTVQAKDLQPGDVIAGFHGYIATNPIGYVFVGYRVVITFVGSPRTYALPLEMKVRVERYE